MFWDCNGPTEQQQDVNQHPEADRPSQDNNTRGVVVSFSARLPLLKDSGLRAFNGTKGGVVVRSRGGWEPAGEDTEGN